MKATSVAVAAALLGTAMASQADTLVTLGNLGPGGGTANWGWSFGRFIDVDPATGELLSWTNYVDSVQFDYTLSEPGVLEQISVPIVYIQGRPLAELWVSEVGGDALATTRLVAWNGNVGHGANGLTTLSRSDPSTCFSDYGGCFSDALLQPGHRYEITLEPVWDSFGLQTDDSRWAWKVNALGQTGVYFNGLYYAEGATPAWQVTVSVPSAVPEPATWGLMLGGAGLLAAWRRRRA